MLGWRGWVAGLVLVSAGTAAQAPLPAVAGDCAVVAMVPAPIPVIEVMIDGKGPYRFGIDTGAQGHGRISPALAAELGLETIGEVRTPAPGGTLATRPIYGLPELSVSDVRFTALAMVALSDVRGPDTAWDGILGNDLLQVLPLTLDYGNARVGFGGPLPKGTFKIGFDRGIPKLPVEIAGQRFEVDFDSGNGAGGLFLGEAEAKALPLAGEPVERGKARTSFGDFAIMEAPLGVPVTVGRTVLPVRAIGWPSPRPGGNLGSKAMAGMTVTFDGKTGVAAIAPSGPPAACPA